MRNLQKYSSFQTDGRPEVPPFKPGEEMIADIVSQLQRRIHIPFIIIPEDDGINVLLLSRCHQRAVQRRAFFRFDGKEEILIHQKIPAKSILQDILSEDATTFPVVLNNNNSNEFVERIVVVVRKLRL